MNIMGLPEFSLDDVTDYITNKSSFLPVLAKIKLPEHIPNYAEIETQLKTSAVQLAYLRLCEDSIRSNLTSLLNELRNNPQDQHLLDHRSALNLQLKYVLSLNEQITSETLSYFNSRVIQSDQSYEFQDIRYKIDQLVNNGVLSSESRYDHEKNVIEIIPVQGENFYKLLEAVKQFIMDKRYQSTEILIPDVDYLGEYLKNLEEKDVEDPSNKNPKLGF